MPQNEAQALQEQASQVIAKVSKVLTGNPVTIDFETYFARGPVLSVKATNDHGTSISRDFNFHPEDELKTIQLVDSIALHIAVHFDFPAPPAFRTEHQRNETPASEIEPRERHGLGVIGKFLRDKRGP